jgi:polyhydroxyalkanoate synthesis repressor PhaR
MTIDSTDSIVIKKYPSRRLYDTHNKCFLTIRQLGNMIRGGKNVTIIDNESGEDITKSVLTQVVMEAEKSNQDILPVNLLHQLIRSSGSAYKGVLDGVLAKGAKTLQKAKEGVESSLHIKSRSEETVEVESEADELEKIKARLAELEGLLKKKGT